MEFLKHTLDNGLTIIAESNPSAYSMALGYFVNTGSRDEDPSVAGVSHFLEHMAFKGTPTRSAADVNRELDEIGSQSNAYTSEEHTVYYAAFVPDYQDQAVTLLSDMMRPALRTDDFEVEKKVIVEEIRKYDDQPPFGAHEKCMAAYFGDHPLGNNILGTVASVEALTPEQMRDYFRKRYAPGNLTLAAAGNVDFPHLVDSVTRLCGDWQPYEAERRATPAKGNADESWIHRAQATQEYIIEISSGPHANHPDRFAHRLMSVILGDEGGSRMFWAFVDSGLAEYASVGTYEFEGSGITMTFLSCAPQDTRENIELLSKLQQQIQAEGVTDDELEIAKNKTCSQVVRRAERPMNRLFAVGHNWIHRGCYHTVRESVESYRAVTIADIERTLNDQPLAGGARVFAGPLQDGA